MFIKQNLNYISLFSSAGVGCHGFKLNGFDCIATNELVKRRIEVQKFNKKCKYNSGYILGDITKKNIKKKIFIEIDRWKNIEKINEVDVIIATPPCQGMSVANHKKKNELRRNSLVVESIELVKEIQPRFFIFENVRSFLKTPCTDIDGELKPIKEAISQNLAGSYNIVGRVLNFKDLGVHSSRTRSLVIGARKDLKEITAYDLLPDFENAKTLKEIIGDLPSLKKMGEISSFDIYHNFKKYDPNMRKWILGVKEGQSAFDNKDPKRRPHRIIEKRIIYNKNKNGDKYRRCYWNKVAPCIHTRNDILASQSTIHPKDDRVFSIRELMRIMTIPDSFEWMEIPNKELNSFPYEKKIELLKNNEINIRQSIGEAVPTLVFHKIAKKIYDSLIFLNLSKSRINYLIKKNNLNNTSNLVSFIKENKGRYNFIQLARISELANSKITHNAAYYTNQDICFSMIEDLPSFSNTECLKILEPSVGSGNFLPLLINKYKTLPKVVIDLIDIDKKSLDILKELIKYINIPKNIKLNFINDDFLLHNFKNSASGYFYNLVIGNPPFKKVTNKNLLTKYRIHDKTFTT